MSSPSLYSGQIRRWTAPGKWVPFVLGTPLYMDDTIARVRETISVAAAAEVGGVCMWTELQPTPALLSATAERLKLPVDVRAVRKTLDVLFVSKAAAAPPTCAQCSDAGKVAEMLSEWCESHPSCRLVVPVGESYVDPETKALAVMDGANPFRPGMTATTDVHLMTRSDSTHYTSSQDREMMLLEDVISGGALNFATFEDVEATFPDDPSHVAKFFPKIGSVNRTWNTARPEMPKMHKGVANVACEFAMKGATLMLSMRQGDDLSVSDMFSVCTMSKKVPLVVLHNPSTGSTNFRMFKEAVQDNAMKQHVAGWVTDSLRRGNNRRAASASASSAPDPYLKVYVARKTGAPTWVRIGASGRLMAASMGNGELPHIEAIRTAISALGVKDESFLHEASEVMDAFENDDTPDTANALSTVFGSYMINGRFHMTVVVEGPQGKATGFDELQRAIQNSPVMRHRFVVTSANAKDGIVLRYIQATGGSRNSRLMRLVQSMWSRPRSEVESALQRVFGLSASAASALVQRQSEDPVWTARDPSWIDTVPIVSIDRTGQRISITNVTRGRYVDRICQALRHLFGNIHELSELPLQSPSSSDVAQRSSDSDAAAAPEDPLDLDQFLYGTEDTDPDPAPPVAQRSSDEPAAAAAAAAAAAEIDLLDVKNGDRPDSYSLNQLYRADIALFKFKGTKYGSVCGHNNGRQPIVVSRGELDRIDREHPGAHKGALLDYGTTPEKAARNAYICPKYWCVRDRTALAKDGKCPNGDKPLTFASSYFGNDKNKDRYVGVLDQKNHPDGFCMPCCFIKPPKADQVAKCAPAKISSTNEDEDEEKVHRDGRYVMSDTTVLEEGRYAVLPKSIMDVIGGSKKCGNRDDGSGNLSLWNSCYAQRGVSLRSSRQRFLDCMVYAMDNPRIKSTKDLAQAIVDNLTISTFVRLNGGRLAREYLSRGNLDTIRDEAAKPENGSASNKARFEGFRYLSHSEPRSKLLMAAMHAYFNDLKDASVVKTPDRHGLLELLSMPSTWLNSHGSNVMILYVDDSGDGADADSSVQCPLPLSSASSNWRYDAPTVLVLKRGGYFQPIVYLTQARTGMHETMRMHSEMHPHVAVLVHAYIGACDVVGRAGLIVKGRALMEGILAAVAAEGRKVTAQVVDYWFRPTGLVLDNGLYLPLPHMTHLLSGNTGLATDLIYLSDVSRAATDAATDAKDAHRLLSAIGEMPEHAMLKPVSGISAAGNKAPKPPDAIAWRVASGALVPLGGFQDSRVADGSQWLQEMNEFLELAAPAAPATTASATTAASAPAVAEEAMRVWRHIRSDKKLTMDVVMLRSSLHPFSIEQKRVYAHALLRPQFSQQRTRAAYSSMQRSQIVDEILFGVGSGQGKPGTSPPPPAASVVAQRPDQQHLVVQFTDVDVATMSVDAVMRQTNDSSTMVRSVVDTPVSLPDTPWLLMTNKMSIIAQISPGQDEDKDRGAKRADPKKSIRLRTRAMSDIDVYATIHLAHRILYSDAPLPFYAVVSAMQNFLLTRGTKLHLEPHATLAQMQSPQQRAQAIGKGAFRSTDYRYSTAEIEMLSEYLGVPVTLDTVDGTHTKSKSKEQQHRYIYLKENTTVRGRFTLVWSPIDNFLH